MKNKNFVMNLVGTGICTIAMIFMCSVPALASNNTYAENGAKWVLDGVFWIVAVAGILGAGMSAVKRNATAAVGILLSSAIVCIFCKNPELLVTIGNTLKGIIGL